MFFVETGVLLLSLIVIVASAELFTNGIEWLGQRLELSEGVVGSVLAAVGTALPETLIPIVAVCFFGTRHGADVGIGAITGAPFMLSTLTLGLCGSAAWWFARAGRRPDHLKINQEVLTRDLKFFIAAYVIALLTSMLSGYPAVRYVVAVVLLGIYPLYLYKTFSSEGEMGSEPETLYFDRLIKRGSNRLRLILPQVLTGLAGIVGGAYFFVEYIQDIAEAINFPPLVLSLIVSPIATELPEKIKSVLWVRNGKDTLALGNVTGALVFQSCIPVAFGVAFTEWALDAGTIFTGVVAVCSATVFVILISKGKLKFQYLALGALAYAIAVSVLLALDVHTSGSHPQAHNGHQIQHH